MTDETTAEGAHHVLLIGIDAYEVKPLKGCVNDIDTIQRLLLDRAKIPASQITRLVSPHSWYEPDTRVEAKPATLVNIVDELAKLGSETVQPTDRVFVYYAGHGTRVEVADGGTAGFRGGTTRFREALVPVDGSMAGPTLLFDYELNALLASIAKRTRAVTVILDCCHSSGATRSVDPTGSNTRFVDLSSGDGQSGPATMSEGRADLVAAAVRSAGAEPVAAGEEGDVDDCHIVAACLNHEVAKETPRKVREGETRSGLLTRSLTDALSEIPDEELTSVTWGRFWNQVRTRIETDPERPAQHSWMSGGLARAWLAGPPNDGDAGLGLQRTSSTADEYTIDAGTIAGVTKGAQIAVYGVEPFRFHPVDSEEDIASRSTSTLLEVTEASLGAATAIAKGDAFDLPVGARGRLVAPGEAEALSCAVVPEHAGVVEAVRESNLVEVVPEASAVARLEQEGDGTWVLTDDVHGVRPDDPVLIRLGADEVVDEARHVLEHYIRYAGPIRMAQRCGDLPNALQIDLLHCPPDKMVDGKIPESEIPNLPELPPEADGSYSLVEDTDFCIRIRNTSKEQLKVHLFHSDASGSVGLLGEQEIDGRTIDHFWWNSEIGGPFRVSVQQPGEARCIDRFVVIGTTDMGADLHHLVEHGRFRREATRAIGGGPRAAAPPAVQWTAVERIIRTDKPA